MTIKIGRPMRDSRLMNLYAHPSIRTACLSTPVTIPTRSLLPIRVQHRGHTPQEPTLAHLPHLRPAGSFLLLSPILPRFLFLTILILIITTTIITTPPLRFTSSRRHLHLHIISPVVVWLLGRGCFIRLPVRGRRLPIRLRLRRFIQSSLA
jgi:hypothetical protein